MTVLAGLRGWIPVCGSDPPDAALCASTLDKLVLSGSLDLLVVVCGV